MENLTNYNETSYIFRREVWITNILSRITFLVVSFYLFVALVYHQVKVEKPKEVKFLQLTLEQKYGVLSRYTCITTSVFSVIWYASGFGLNTLEGFTIFFNESTQQSSAAEVACYLLPLIAGIATTVGNFSINIFLWLRQNIFYVHSSLKILYNTCLKAFSYSALIFFFLFVVSLVFAYLIKVQFTLNVAGFCQVQVRNGDSNAYLQILTASTIASILIQISLLGLFIYPLLKQASWQRKLSGKKTKKSKKNSCVQKRVKKAVILASVCLITDILTVVATRLAFEENKNNFSFMYDINLAINQLVTIACFDHWKKLLWPWNMNCLINSASTVDKSLSEQTTNCRRFLSVAVTGI